MSSRPNDVWIAYPPHARLRVCASAKLDCAAAHVVGMKVIDSHGNSHHTAGTPEGGRFAPKANSAPLSQLAATSPRVTELREEYHQLWISADAQGMLSRPEVDREALARTTTDPALLAALTGDLRGDVGHHVATNPATPAPVLHDIATDRRWDRKYQDRFEAISHPNIDVATLELLWSRTQKDDPYIDQIREDMARVPKATGPMLAMLLRDRYSEEAGAHPNLPGPMLDAWVRDAELAHLVIRNPKLTDEQLRSALAATSEHLLDDDDSSWPVIVAVGVTQHPNTTVSTLRDLDRHPDAHVRNLALERARQVSAGSEADHGDD